MESMCRNQLLIRGHLDEVARFRADARIGKAPLSFHALRPAPTLPDTWNLDELARALTAKQPDDSFKTAAAWRLAHWGSHVEPADVRVAQEPDGTLRYDFYGQPPIALLRFVAASRPSLRLSLAWFDPNARFAGQLTASGTRISLREARGTEGMIDVLAGTPIHAEVRAFFADECGD